MQPTCNRTRKCKYFHSVNEYIMVYAITIRFNIDSSIDREGDIIYRKDYFFTEYPHGCIFYKLAEVRVEHGIRSCHKLPNSKHCETQYVMLSVFSCFLLLHTVKLLNNGHFWTS